MPFPMFLKAGSLVTAVLLAWSAVKSGDPTTWILEVVPVFVALPIMWATARRYPLTSLLYVLIACHFAVLIVGGAYSYARVPLGYEIAECFGLTRNPYDKIGHFFQGFVPTLVARELIVRGDYVRRGKMLNFVLVCIALAISATYELLEWGAAVTLGSNADDFLGMQGDPWDAQSDMLFALIGSTTAIVALSRFQDRLIAQLPGTTSRS